MSNGDRDDDYVNQHYVPQDQVPADPDRLRAEMLAGRLPLPGYLRSGGVEMAPADLLGPAEQAGGTDQLQAWFVRQEWPSPEIAAD
jgi:hypothetical protein